MMTATLAIRDLALQMLAQESSPNGAPEDLILRAQRVFERLRVHLTIFVGTAGYRAMLSRALVMVKSQEPSLREFAVSMEGTLDLATHRDNHEAMSGVILLLAQLLGLIETLVGEALMLRLVQDVWPMVTLDLSLNAEQIDREVIP